MLILTRRVGESLMIGDEISITVTGIKGGEVRLGINAPRHVTVHREEIYYRIAAERGLAKLPDQATTPDPAPENVDDKANWPA